jgi:hypothetical protein
MFTFTDRPRPPWRIVWSARAHVPTLLHEVFHLVTRICADKRACRSWRTIPAGRAAMKRRRISLNTSGVWRFERRGFYGLTRSNCEHARYP